MFGARRAPHFLMPFPDRDRDGEGAINGALFFAAKRLLTATCRRPINVNALSGARMKQRSDHQVDQKQAGRNEEQEQRTRFHR